MSAEPIGYLNTAPREPTPSKRKLFYGRKRWKLIRKAKLSREPVCEDGCGALANEVDHVDGDNANNAADNLRSLCKRCHSRKTKRTT